MLFNQYDTRCLTPTMPAFLSGKCPKPSATGEEERRVGKSVDQV